MATTLIRGQTSWDCGLCSWQMALRETREQLLYELGHNGEELVDDCYPQAFHHQEFIPLALRRGFRPVWIERFPCNMYPSGYMKPILNNVFFDSQIKTQSGVLVCRAKKANHSVYFENGKILDPAGFAYTYEVLCQVRTPGDNFRSLQPLGAFVL